MSTPTKLGAKAANSLREKRGRIGPSSSRSPGNSPEAEGGGRTGGSRDDHDDGDCPDALETSAADSQASGSSRGNVYSFFDPSEIRRPPASPSASSDGHGGGSGGGGGGRRPFDEPSTDPPRATLSGASESLGVGSGISGIGMSGVSGISSVSASGDHDGDAASCSAGSAATERICNVGGTPGNNNASSVPSSGGGSAGGGGPAAALAAASVRPSAAAWIDEDREVKYEEGATELFLLVEDGKWEEVCDRVEEEPSEARVWVVSSGTENTVFSWSVWRRLPLHEACRRQPPPVVVYSLLSAYPESSMAESNFGELPLHAAVRCGACAEVVNCILASYPAAALARDNSGCTPLDILNGTGKMMDHDAVVAALNRTIAVLNKEEQSWEQKISSLQQEFKQSKEKRRREYERIVANKNAEIEDLRRTLDQEKLATSNLASKVIQTEQVVQDKGRLEKRYVEKIKKMDEEVRELRSSNSSRKATIKDLEDIVRSDRKTILELNNRIQTLQSSLTSLLEEEEAFASTKLARAEKNFKTLMESQFVFLRETERRKDLLRSRVKQLGINIPPKKRPDGRAVAAAAAAESRAAEEEEKRKIARRAETPPVEEVSNNEVAEKALAGAMAHLNTYVEGVDDEVAL